MRQLTLIFLALCALALTLICWVTFFQTDHGFTLRLTVFSFIFVVGFVSLLILRVLVFAMLAIVQQVFYRRDLKQYIRSGKADLDESPLISIIVPAYNESKVIHSAISSHLRIDYPNFEIVVVDDGSSDNTAECAKAFIDNPEGREVRVFSIPNSGKGNALNYGIQQAEGDFILCVDADSHIDHDALWYAMRHFEDPRVGAVAGNVKVINRRGILSNLQGMEYIVGQNLMRRLQTMFNIVSIVPGPLGLFRRETLHSAGYYNEDTFAEDCDITLTILAQGWKVVYELNAIARTEAPETLYPFMRQRYRWTRGTLQSLIKHRRHLLGVGGVRMAVILWNMVFDGIVWPVANMICHFCVFYLIFQIGLATYLVFWWVHFTLLDMALALLCLATEREDPRLAWHALVYRLLFVMMMDLCKCMATIEEFMKIGMGWGKLERTGHAYTEEEWGNADAAG